ncbi:TauD/TfdA dioxygenase family protein [Paracraurococcus lichenis]|uniref:TauD/TfdA family dioxygenase n=1 Tax=Paracraurococcus lichenis TaxID=3064888 RepID=A0ABT9DST3_9PROT|nr:TauD/TfdA family dioxygenase [Paracraurococcus sp. LOR1-02]MDO9706957.1 TauD/TfdA family dioxygenase [Paracraurococcus sp. LOR1-02]
MVTTLTPARLTRQAAGIGLRPLHPAIGAEVTGLDLAAPLAAPVLDVLHDALIEHGVLLLRGQRALPEALARGLAAAEAPLLGQAMHQAPPPLPLAVGPTPDLPPPGAAPDPFWHADRSYAAEPALACLLRAEAAGGTIAFIDQRRALARLPAGLRGRLESLRAVHASPLDPAQRSEHPVLRQHPVTGEASLYVNPAFATRILNLPAAESRRLLDLLLAAATEEALAWRHAWQPGDVLVWDNRSVLHTACGGPGYEALRIGGDHPTGFDAPSWVVAG